MGNVNAPAVLFVPRALMSLARRITTPSTQYVASPTNAGSDVALDPLRWQGQLKVCELTHATNTTDYYVMADPAKMDTFVLQRLVGVPQPEFFQQFSLQSLTRLGIVGFLVATKKAKAAHL